MTKQPSKERGCTGKANLGSKIYKESADRIAKKHCKNFAVYRCPHCQGTHLTTKEIDGTYAEVLYQTNYQEDNRLLNNTH